MTEPNDRFVSARVIGRGVSVAPAFRKGIAGTLLLAFVGTGARLVIPILIQQTIDNALTGELIRLDLVVLYCSIGALSVLISSIALRKATLRLGSRAEDGLYTLRVKLFDHIHKLSLASHNDEKRGALVSRVTSDIETLTQFFTWGGLTLLLDGFQMIAVFIVMIAYDWRLAVVALVVSVPLVFVLRIVQFRLITAHNVSRERNALLLGNVGEMLAGFDTHRAYGSSARVIERVEKDVADRARSNIRAGFIGAFLFPSGEVFAVFTVVAVVTAGLFLGPAGGLTSGALVGFVFLTYRFLEPIAEFTEVIDQTQNAVSGLRRVLSVLDTPVGPPAPSLPIPLPQGVLSIDLDRVSFAYTARDSSEDDGLVLNDISLHIPGGQHVALVGPSGSGKTTVARLIARLFDPTLGFVSVGGVSLKQVDNDELRRRMVVVPQEPFLFAQTIRENLLFACPEATDSELLASFRDLDLHDWLISMPSGLDTHVGQRGGSLSAGERQLIALVRASIVKPDVLVLDEATSAVDAATEVRISRALQRLAEGRTTVSIAHRLSTAARAQRVVLMRDGRVVEDGSHQDLLVRGGDYAKLYATWVSATEGQK